MTITTNTQDFHTLYYYKLTEKTKTPEKLQKLTFIKNGEPFTPTEKFECNLFRTKVQLINEKMASKTEETEELIKKKQYLHSKNYQVTALQTAFQKAFPQIKVYGLA